jgi:hypothetical protein
MYDVFQLMIMMYATGYILFCAQEKPPHILTGPLVLQIDEVANIGQSLMQQKAAAESGVESTSQKRMLKLYLTDGVRTIIAAEEHFIASLSAKTPAGGKVSEFLAITTTKFCENVLEI